MPITARMKPFGDLATRIALQRAAAQCACATERQLGQHALHLKTSTAASVLFRVNSTLAAQNLHHAQFGGCCGSGAIVWLCGGG